MVVQELEILPTTNFELRMNGKGRNENGHATAYLTPCAGAGLRPAAAYSPSFLDVLPGPNGGSCLPPAGTRPSQDEQKEMRPPSPRPLISAASGRRSEGDERRHIATWPLAFAALQPAHDSKSCSFCKRFDGEHRLTLPCVMQALVTPSSEMRAPWQIFLLTHVEVQSQA